MTQKDYFAPACRDVRLLLGVYVVGAIEPAERSVVDAHLGSCQSCRDELAGLAGLPAMLSRVPAEDVEQLDRVSAGLPADIEAPEELLNSVLARVTARRRARLWRGAVAAAAAVAVAAGGATIAVELTQPQPAEVVSAVDPTTHVGAVVKYVATPLGMAMRVEVRGVPLGTKCEFYVVGKNGTALVRDWEVGYGQHWYSAASDGAPSSVTGFKLTDATGKTLVTIPA